jgi:hypothetical protein
MCIKCSVQGSTARCTLLSIHSRAFFIDLVRRRHPAHLGRTQAGLDGHVRLFLYTQTLSLTHSHPGYISGFGRNMGDSAMVVVWPSRGPSGNHDSVTLSQRKAPYEVMPTPDPHPPFVAKLSFTETWVRAWHLPSAARRPLFLKCAPDHRREPPSSFHTSSK